MHSRSFNVIRNVIVSLVCQMITIILGFSCRKALIVSLGLAYVGANSLFSSIISILSFVELGIGNAIVFSLYKPIADNEYNKIAAYIRYYKKVYTGIALAILFAGLLVVPFLRIIVQVDSDITENLYVMYAMTLMATACTYLFAAPKTLLIADQKQYIEKIIYQTSHFCQVGLQILILFLFKNYYLFLLLQIVFALANNIVASIIVKRMYPFINDSTIGIDKSDKLSLFSDIRAMFCYKVGTSLLNYIDTVFISSFCGLVFLGKIANYTLILATLSGVVTQLTSALSASIGNKNAMESTDKCRETFEYSIFVIIWVTGFFFVAFSVLVNPFISMIYGTDCVVTNRYILISLAICYFVSDTHSLSAVYRYSMGVFRQGKFAPLIASAINVFLSVVLFKIIGVPGLYIATIIARVSTLGIVDSNLILGGKDGTKWYFATTIRYCLVIALLFIGIFFTFAQIPDTGLISWILKGIALTVIYNGIWILVFYRTHAFKYLKNYLWRMIGKAQ